MAKPAHCVWVNQRILFVSTPLTHSQKKRAAVLEAALAEFQAHGFAATSMDRVSQRAGVSKRTVYNHFPSKDALFTAIASDMVAQLHAAPTVAYDPEQPLDVQLTALAALLVEQFSSEWFVGVTRVILAEAFRSPALVERAFGEAGAKPDVVGAWVQAAVNDGRLAVPSVAFAVEQFNALLKGPLFWPQAIGFGPPVTPDARTAVVAGAVQMFLGQYAI